MHKRQMVCAVTASSLLTLTIIVSVILAVGQTMAAPAAGPVNKKASQVALDKIQFYSVSALAFQPVQPNAAYEKDVQRQILSLTGQNRNFVENSNLFVAPLQLPDRTRLIGVTLFGEDFDSQGEVRLRLKRCDHSQARCVILAETTSTTTLAAGQFQTPSVAIPNETVENRFFTYFWEITLTALFNSGARSVRLEVLPPDSTDSTETGQWTLTENVFRYSLPNSDFTQARICSDDLSHLNNPTHYPFVVVDGVTGARLGSNECTTVNGLNIEIRRNLNTGPSSGTYEFVK